MFKQLKVYTLEFDLAMEIFQISKSFPKEEKYSITDQIRRSSRSVCANVGEGYRKRQYPAHFVNKLSDSDMENTETQVWIDFAYKCGYIKTQEYKLLLEKSANIGRMLGYMISKPEIFLPKPK